MSDQQESSAINRKALPCHLSPRCGAHSRRTGNPCRSPAMRNGRCRMHGGKAGRKPTHGRHTRAAIAERREVRKLIRDVRELLGLA